MRPDQAAYLAAGLPVDPDWGGLGAVYRPPDPRDRSVLSDPRVLAAFNRQVGAADLIAAIGSPLYNQGAYPACASAGTCCLQSIDESVNNNGRWPLYDWLTVYRENGGNNRDGVDPQRVLADAVNNGLPLAGSGVREKIVTGYAFVPQAPATFAQVVTACIAAGYPVGLALLLPAPFGWNSGTNRTQGYHWMSAVASDPAKVTCVNTWGDRWPSDNPPRPGLCRIAWSYLTQDNLQNGLCYAFTTQRAGSVNPPPPLPPLTVTAVQPNVAAFGQTVTVTGSGFLQPGLRWSWSGMTLQFHRRSDSEVALITPALAGTFSVIASVGAITVVGPGLTVQGSAPPPPPDLSLAVNVALSDGRTGSARIPLT